MAKETSLSFWKEALTHSLKKDIPIIAYMVYLATGVLKYGLVQIRENVGFGSIGILILLLIIVLPGLFVAVRIWKTM